jgi:hypothetical protein
MLPPEVATRINKADAQIEQLSNVMNLMRLDKQNALVRRLVKKQQDGTLGQPDQAGDGEEGGDDVAEDDKVNFGDTVHNIYTLTDALQGKAAPSAAAGVAKSTLPLILAAAIGGGGFGAALMALPALWKGTKPPTVITTDTDTDTRYTLEFSGNEAAQPPQE